MQLEGFSLKRTSPTKVWCARCPICGDSAHSKRKKRFYFHMDKDKEFYLVSCRNCNYATSFISFIKEYHHDIYQDMVLEVFRSGKKRTPEKVTNHEKRVVKALTVNIANCSSLSHDHPAAVYLRERMIPTERFSRLLYTDNFLDFVVSTGIDVSQLGFIPDDKRIVFVFRNRDGDISHIQGRAIDKESTIRYMTITVNDSLSKVYGLDYIDLEKPIYVVEGGFDSLFLPNCVATADSNLLSFDGDIYIPDNQYRNESVVKVVNSIIESGKKIVLFPADFPYKDINEAVMHIGLRETYVAIKRNVYSGLAAKLRWTQLRKV